MKSAGQALLLDYIESACNGTCSKLSLIIKVNKSEFLKFLYVNDLIKILNQVAFVGDHDDGDLVFQFQ